MYCRKCGTEMSGETEFCPACGTSVYEESISDETRKFHRTMNELFHEEQEEELRKAFVRRILCFVVPLAIGGALSYSCFSDDLLEAILVALGVTPFFWVGYTCFRFCYSRLKYFVPILGAIISFVVCIAAMLLVSSISSYVPSFLQYAVVLVLIAAWYIWYVISLKKDFEAWRIFSTVEKKS